MAEKRKLTEQEKREFLEKLKSRFKDNENGNEQMAQQEIEKARRVPDIIGKAHDEFNSKTSLTKKDKIFVSFAAVLQIVRQQLVNKFKVRLDDKQSAAKIYGHANKYSGRGHKYYASVDEITSNPVPFDCIRKEECIRNTSDDPKLSGFDHRYKTLGHDPILGWIFGTANILTNTLSMTEGGLMIKTYHVHSGVASNSFAEYQIDKICETASTLEMFNSIFTRISAEGKHAWEAIGIALFKECEHLLSDIQTQKSLPLPILSWLQPNMSRMLNYAGVDSLFLATTSAEAMFANLINFIISKLHEWCYDEATDGLREAYMARTIKVVNYSNEIALGSSTLETLVRAYMGDETAVMKYDFGGTIVTLKEVLLNPVKIADLRHDYAINEAINYLNS